MEPTFFPPIAAPTAWQASSITFSPCRSAIAWIAAISAGWPKMCTGRIAFVFGVIFASIFAGSML